MLGQQLMPQESLEDVTAFWSSHVNNEYYTDEHRGSDAYFDEIETRRYRWHYHLRDFFERHRGRSGKLLEIGCGIGVDSIRLRRCGYEVTAVDLTEAAISVAREYAARRGLEIDFKVSNGEELPFEDESFDSVYSFGVLHHTPDIRASIGEVRRVLRPRGKAYIMLYHKNSLVNFIHWLFRLPYESPRDLKDHCPVVYRFSRRDASELFSEFSSVEMHSAYPFTYGFRHLTFWLPAAVQRLLGRWIGWHLMIEATR